MVTPGAITKKIMDTRYVGTWIYLVHYLPESAEAVAEAIGATPEFAREAMNHFEEIGCLQRTADDTFLTDAPLLYEDGSAEVAE